MDKNIRFFKCATIKPTLYISIKKRVEKMVEKNSRRGIRLEGCPHLSKELEKNELYIRIYGASGALRRVGG